jgi:FixJ family two-component response regulator
MTLPTVFVVDDDDAVRDGLAMLLGAAGFAYLGFNCAEAFLDAWRPDWSGCLILDVCIPGMDGPSLQEEMACRGIHLPIIFLSGHGDISIAVRTMKAGANDFLVKPIDGGVLLERVQAALENCRTEQQIAAKKCEYRKLLAMLTEREQEILSLAIVGKSNKEIARHLAISYRTVETHRSHILLKTGVRSLMELAGIAAIASPHAAYADMLH